MKRVLRGAVCAALLGAASAVSAWEVASYTPSAVVPLLPAADQAVALRAGQQTPLCADCTREASALRGAAPVSCQPASGVADRRLHQVVAQVAIGRALVEEVLVHQG